MNTCTNLIFNSEEINITNFLSALKQIKDKIEKNNSVVYLDNKYLKQLMKNCEHRRKEEKNSKIILLSAKSRGNDYHYFIRLELDNSEFTKLFKVTDVTTNDSEYDGSFTKPNYKKNLTAICFTKKGKRILARK